jgi:hypothetical protein
MALALNDRVQQQGTANTTVSFTLTSSVIGFQSFAVIGNGNTTYYSATDASGNWEVGIGTYSTTGPTLTRTTILSSSNSNTAVTFSGVVNVFVTYPSDKSVNLDGSDNVSALGTISSGTWQGSTVGVAYGGTGVTTSSGANSVVLRDANQNIDVNRVNQANTNTTAAGGTTALTVASSYIHSLVGTGGQTYTLPDATTLTTGVAFIFNNLATGTLTIQNFATATIGTIPSGGAGAVFLTANPTVGGTWDLHGYLPEGVTFGTNAFNLGTSVITGGTWQGGTIQPTYGGTGLTSFSAANNALYSTGASTLTAGTLPTAAGGTALTSYTTGDVIYASATNTLAKLPIGTTGQVLSVSGGIPTWSTPSANVSSFQTSLSGLTPSTATTGAVTLAGTLGVGSGGTGLTSLTANRIPYGNDTSAFQSSANLTFNGTTLTANDITDTSLTSGRVIYAGTGGNLIDSSSLTYNNTTGSLTAPQFVASNGLNVNNGTINTSYTFPTGYNSVEAGDITLASGVTVTVPSTSRWVII